MLLLLSPHDCPSETSSAPSTSSDSQYLLHSFRITGLVVPIVLPYDIMSSCSFAAEETLGPVIAECRRPFDFSLLFEQVFFQLLPSAIFIIGAVARSAYLNRQPIRIARRRLYVLKLVSIPVFSLPTIRRTRQERCFWILTDIVEN